MSEETKNKIRNSLKGKLHGPMSEEQKDKLRKINIGKKNGPKTEEAKERIKKFMTVSDKARQDMSERIDTETMVKEAIRQLKPAKAHCDACGQPVLNEDAKQSGDLTEMLELSRKGYLELETRLFEAEKQLALEKKALNPFKTQLDVEKKRTNTYGPQLWDMMKEVNPYKESC